VNRALHQCIRVESLNGQTLKEKVGLGTPSHFLLGHEIVYRVVRHGPCVAPHANACAPAIADGYGRDPMSRTAPGARGGPGHLAFERNRLSLVDERLAAVTAEPALEWAPDDVEALPETFDAPAPPAAPS